jgi:hypothetical protein
MPGTRRVKVNRENGEAYPVHTGLPGIIAGSGPTANALCGAVMQRVIVCGIQNHIVKR